jgi:hypothetical protein
MILQSIDSKKLTADGYKAALKAILPQIKK